MSDDAFPMSAIAECISQGETFAVSGHVNPDGDCIASVLAMVGILRQLGKSAVPLLANMAPAPAKYAFLEGHGEFVHASDYDGSPDVFISVDTATVDRMGDSLAVMERAGASISIDHHPGGSVGAGIELVDDTAAAACILVWDLAKALLDVPDASIASACYAGLLTDTGRFQFQNTDARSLTCAGDLVAAGADPAFVATEVYQNRPLPAIQLEGRMISRLELSPHGLIAYAWVDDSDYVELGAKMEDTEGLVDTVRAVAGIEAALLIRGRRTDVRCSIRAKRDLDVSEFARRYGGGGHKAAAGFTLDGLLPDRMGDIIEAIEGFERELLEARGAVD